MEIRHCCVVDETGRYVTLVRVRSDGNTEGYILREGERLIATRPPHRRGVGEKQGLLEPRWVGEEWSEGADEETLAEWERDQAALEVKSIPATEERLAALEAAMIAMMEVSSGV